MPSAAEQVNSTFTTAQSYASAAQTSLTGFTNALNAAAQANTIPTISFSWATPAAPALPGMPEAPLMPTIQYVAPDGIPTAFTEALPGIAIDANVPVAPAITFPDAPVLSYGVVPTAPVFNIAATPEAPDVEFPDVPNFLSLAPVAFGGVDMHEDWLAKLDTMPSLDILQPTPYSYARGEEYASQLLSNIRAKINERVAGGTGLPAAVEQAIWDRARSREMNVSLANEAEVMRASEALGYALPPGVLAAQLREAQQRYHDKASDLSREIAIKQADLEQANMQQAIASGIQLEGQLIDYSYKLENLTFEAAKAAADNAIAIYNTQVEQYRALLSGYQAFAGAYDTLIRAELSKVEVYKAQLAGEQAKADVNKTLVDQYKAQIEAQMSYVEIYRAQVGAAQALTEIEKARVDAYSAAVGGYVASINAETSKVEAYKAQIQAETTKTEAYTAQTSAYASRVGAQAEYARALVSRYTAIAQAKAAEWDGYRARVGAESTRIEALGKQSTALLEGYRAETTAVVAQAESNIALWNASVTNYQKGREVLLQTSKINSDNVIAVRGLQQDAAKAGAQVYAQLASSAYGMINANASISGTGGTTVSYKYDGKVSGTVSPVASI